jgi:hypothetical protein
MDETLSVVESILCYLRSIRSELNMVDYRMLVTKFGRTLPFVGRERLQESAKYLFDQRILKHGESERHSHPVGVIGGCSGIGKTRALVSIADSIHTWAPCDSLWKKEVIISYNNGNPPICDRTLFGMECSQVVIADKAFALRLLFFAFIYNSEPKVAFESFAREFPKDLLKKLSAGIALSTISNYCCAASGKSNGILFVGVDEINYLLEKDSADEAKNRSFLKATMVAFAGAMISSIVFVFGVVAGTTVLPIDKVFAESGHPTHKMPIGLLQLCDCEAIVDHFAANNSELWGNWRLCRAFRTILSDFASMPRMGEKFLEAVENRLVLGESLSAIDYTVLHSMLSSQLPYQAFADDFSVTLIAKVMLSQHVSRNEVVNSDGGHKFTYGQLEEEGLLVLKSATDTKCIVQLPYSMFRNLLQGLRGDDLLVGTLRTMCALVSGQEDTGGLMWQSFEDLCVYMEASREMLLARTLQEDKLMSVNELYCMPSSDVRSVSAVDDLFEVNLRDRCSTATAEERFPPASWDGAELMIRNKKGGTSAMDSTIVNNAPGALFDSFTVRYNDRAVANLFCGQAKFYLETVVGRGMVEAEATKVAVHMVNYDIDYILVIFATRVSPDVLGNIPPKCIVITGESLGLFFGPIFSGRFHLLAASPKVNVNTASHAELKTIPGIGDGFVRRLQNARAQRPFDDWNDVISRVRKIPRKIELELTY